MNLLCLNCHAIVSLRSNPDCCPACGEALVAQPGPDLDPPDAPPRDVDHRGILLPRRHAVGGVITPR